MRRNAGSKSWTWPTIQEIALYGPWFVRRGGWWSKSWALKHRPEGGCVFLTAGNHCRLHERFGPEVKPFACRLFPFVLVPAGKEWRVGVRFSCPSSAGNTGRRVTEYDSDLVYLAHLLEKHTGRSGASAPAPPLQAGQQVPWPDLLRFVSALVEIVEDRDDRLERRLRKCLALARVCRQARFDKVSGGRLDEFLRLLRSGLDEEVPRDPADVPSPGWVGRVLFRTLLAIFARKDRGHNQGPAARGRLGRLWAGWRFVRGRGRVPRVNSFLPETTFEAVASGAALSPEIDATLERYYVTKLHSLQFCGPPNFNLPFWAGLESLALTLPVILWLTRALAPLGPWDRRCKRRFSSWTIISAAIRYWDSATIVFSCGPSAQPRRRLGETRPRLGTAGGKIHDAFRHPGRAGKPPGATRFCLSSSNT